MILVNIVSLQILLTALTTWAIGTNEKKPKQQINVSLPNSFILIFILTGYKTCYLATNKIY